MKTVWHSGPPPEIGWWPASYSCHIDSIRWYDGITWSQAAFPSDTAEQAADMARFECICPEEINWTERWWLK